MTKSIYKDDPTATYRGYRRQALYCLHRLFEDTLPEDFILQPEGIEDLAILDRDKKLIEIVQVKDHSDNLTISKLEKFFRRVSPYCKPGSGVVVRIVSFGPVGPDVSAAFDNNKETPNRVIETLTKDRVVEDRKGQTSSIRWVSKKAANEILSHMSVPTVVDEPRLSKSLSQLLGKTITAGSPETAFENLMYWLIRAAEKQQQLTRAKVVKKINQIGEFTSQIAAFNYEWNVSIKPVAPKYEGNVERLGQEFFEAGRVQIEHIAQNLDVPRNALLKEIRTAFNRENVVVVRAASGQGKTTLALRYLLNFTPADFRFRLLKATDVQHARRMALAITGHAISVDVPTIVYIDVHPGDLLWREVVRELSGASGIQVLVTIRQEDWFRSRVSLDDFSFVEVELPFDADVGRGIYESLIERNPSSQFLDFEDAWARMGDRQSLFEFVYLLTQSEALSSKISTQIFALQDDVNEGLLGRKELKLLRLVSIASAYEARLLLNRLVEKCGIPEPKRTLERFQKEFLIRTSDDGNFVEGFHAIRSEIVAESLLDPSFDSWESHAVSLLDLLDEEDLESFLLCSFARRVDARNGIVKALSEFTPKTWVGFRGVLVSLQWLGLCEYVTENAEVVDKVRRAFSGGWWFILDWDLAKVRGDHGFGVVESLSNVSKEFAFAAESTSNVRKQQSDKNRVFIRMREWIANVRERPAPPSTVSEFIALSEVMYWLGHLETAATATDWSIDENLQRAFMALPIPLFAEFCSAVRAISEVEYASWFEKNQSRLVQAIRRKAGVIATQDEDQSLIAHYLVDIDRSASCLVQQADAGAKANAEINRLSVERVELFSRCVPGYDRYGTVAYGHRMSLFAGLGDDSEKRMPKENIVMPWLPEFNSLARSIVELPQRPKNWAEYLQRLDRVRLNVVAAFAQLNEAVGRMKLESTIVLRDNDAWNKCKSALNDDFFLPLCAVDEWGFVSESRAKSQPKGGRRYPAVSKFQPFNKAVNEYTRTVGNFMNQALDSLILVVSLRGADTRAKRKAVLKKAEDLGIKEAFIQLSVCNGMDACLALVELQRCEKKYFEGRCTEIANAELRSNEFEAFMETMRKWGMFAYPEQFLDKRAKTHSRHKAPKVSLKDCLRSTLNRLRSSLAKLSTAGITARVLTDEVDWNGDTALWIVFDTYHPLASLAGLESLWFAVFDAFEPDRQKIVRAKAFDLFWKRIVLVPLVAGKSLEQQAFPNMSGATYTFDSKIENQLWRFIPDNIPETAWSSLGLESWPRDSTLDVFDQFSATYSALFHHVDHISDFARCDVDLDELGQEILQQYVTHEIQRLQPILQETFDSAARLLNTLPEISEALLATRPNIIHCAKLLIEMRDALLPTNDFHEQASLKIDDVAEWKERLHAGLEIVGQARCLWIADALRLPGFD